MFCLKGKAVLALFPFWGLLASSVMAQQAEQKLGPERLQSCWRDLASEDESKASRAMLLLTTSPKETVGFLQQNLRPIKVVPEEVARLVADLDSPRFPKREAAMKELEYLGKCGKPLLEKHLKDSKSAEVQRRLGELLTRIPPDPADPATAKAPPPVPPLQGRSVGISSGNGQVVITIDGQRFDLAQLAAPPAPVVFRPHLDWLRATRAVAVLEHLGTPEAKQLLQTMAKGEREATPTRAAREALRLEK